MTVKVCVISSSRADFGLLLPVLRRLRDDPAFSLALVLTGQNLVPGASDALEVATDEKIQPVELVDMYLQGDDAVAIAKSSGHALTGLAETFQRMRPDIVMLLGDRYEILCATLAANLARIPIAHVAGGNVTSGAMDDAFRHAITTMAHVHFVTDESSARRVRQLGESADRIHVTGSPGIDLAMSAPGMTREAFFAAIDLMPGDKNMLVTFHPVTREYDSIAQAEELVVALDGLGRNVGVIVTGSNADPEANAVTAVMRRFAESHDNAIFVASLGSTRFFNALCHVDVIVGNSSSGLLEAPTFGVPTVNIGTRQEGRLMAGSVINCAADRSAIAQAIKQAFVRGRQSVVNPYGDGHASERIVAALKSLPDKTKLLSKRFEDMRA